MTSDPTDTAPGATRESAAAERFGVPIDPEADERLRADLVAITEAEREALRNGALFIGASSHLPAVQRLAGEVLHVANKAADRPNEGATRWEVERIIDSYTLCMVGVDTAEYVSACADDVLAEVLGWPVRYETQEVRNAT